MTKRRKLTDAQARAYIQGEEPFNEIEYLKRHSERLYKAIVNGFKENNSAAYRENLKATALHYLCYDGMNYNPTAKKKLEDFIKENLSEYTAPRKYKDQAVL